MTNQAQKAVDLFSFKVEIFQITDLLVNITKHVLKPTHRVLNDKEKQNLLKKFSLEEKQIPRMLQKDAIAVLRMGEGQVVKVSYSDEITESHVTYRCVW
ncbi:DNA-directed RNA polymerase V subunit 5A [Camellia lanceoleosa]|uniref:DNA-directed RNA polymerase V subunit 5A n=1 Tax=Camellia lanceoleosa TaxID=1840588 RepID=A0ACC0GD39_9ERIC|nr:DNA-directed RNA polymerase V subunit 5A [Camellia lanceoleosa]